MEQVSFLAFTTLNNTANTYNTGLLATPATPSLSITQVVSQRQQSSSSNFLLLRRCQKKEKFEGSNIEILAQFVWDNPIQRIFVQACFSAHPNQSLTQNKSEACTECQVVEMILVRVKKANIWSYQGEYEALSDFYREKVFSQFPLLSGICFDVLDAMNATQVGQKIILT